MTNKNNISIKAQNLGHRPEDEEKLQKDTNLLPVQLSSVQLILF